MRSPSAITTTLTTIVRPITVVAGVFAPGHLGELTRIIDFETAEAALGEGAARAPPPAGPVPAARAVQLVGRADGFRAHHWGGGPDRSGPGHLRTERHR
ncbi:hypothetical protein [Microbacterium sp. A93]|uniref:hypothetical protein n=1 Tax=Microbacterium sp. A93 TaxID=3450716 RepID=UPI003F43FE60